MPGHKAVERHGVKTELWHRSEMDGGRSTGDECEAYAYRVYNGIERETVDKIKQWIIAGG